MDRFPDYLALDNMRPEQMEIVRPKPRARNPKPFSGRDMASLPWEGQSGRLDDTRFEGIETGVIGSLVERAGMVVIAGDGLAERKTH